MADRDDVILAVDLGTGGPKVALVTAAGDVVAHAQGSVALRLLPGGGAEQDPEEWWAAIAAASRRVVEAAPEAARRVAAVCLTAQWFGTVAVDAEGRPLHPALLWLDERGAPYARRVTRGLLRIQGYGARRLARWLRVTGGIPSRTGKDPLGHILFLQAERPDVYRATRWFLEPVDHLNMRLTGIAAAAYDTITGHWVTDNRDLSRVRYDDRLIAWAGIDRDRLPELRPTGSVLGPLLPGPAEELGVAPGVPVVMGTGDTNSAGPGAGAVADLAPHLYVGTSSWVTCHVPSRRTDLLRNITALPSGVPGRYWVAAEQESAGQCLVWFRETLGGGAPIEDLLAEAATAAPGSGGLLFLPWLKGERTPVEDHHARGGFWNLSLAHTRADMVRAVLEGVALNARWMHATVERFVRRRLDRIPFVGGGARSPLWAQILADVLDRTILRVRDPLLVNVRGAALLAAAALGRISYADIEGRVAVEEVHRPDPGTREVYDPMFREFVGLYRRNRRAFARMNPEDHHHEERP